MICNSKPYELNISKLSQKIGINRNTLYQYIYYLSRGKVFNLVHQEYKGDNIFNKPSKLYLSNTNLHYAYCENQDKGTIRESFFVSMINNYFSNVFRPGLSKDYLKTSKQGDFIVDNRYIIEIGGAKKSYNQIKDLKNSYIAADDIEIGFKNKIPLWLFGFMY